MKLTEKSNAVFECVKSHGGHVAVTVIAEELGLPLRSINANITDLCSEKKGLCVRVKIDEGGDKPVTYVDLTEAGKNFVPDEE